MTWSCFKLAYLMAFIYSACGACALFDYSNAYRIKETDLNGTQLANGTKAQNESIRLDIVDGTINPIFMAELSTFFRIVTTPSSFIIYTNKSLDSEYFYEKFHEELTFVQLSLSCGFLAKQLSLNVSIEPVNEFPPDLGGPYHACLPIDTPALADVFNLSAHVCDRDVGGTTRLVYQVQPFQRATGHGERYLEFVSPLVGIIRRNNVTLKYSDYLNLPLHLLYLNMTVKDGALETWTILVVDMIEEPCSGGVNCSAQRYTATIMETDKNIGVHVQPKLPTCDPQNHVTPCVYSITSGNADGMFMIDNTTGELTLLNSVLEVGLTEEFLTLELQVSKIINCSEETVLTNVAILTVNVYRSKDHTPATDSGVLAPLIIIGVALVAFVGALSFANIVVCVKNKLKSAHTADT